jgi:HAD superfamily hydrolase (TIGR01509 family)
MEKVFEEYLKKHNYANFDLKAVLFDMDGVLYDSMKYHASSWFVTMTEFGLKTNREEFYMYEGVVGRETIDDIIRREWGRPATEKEIKDIYTRKTELFVQYNKGDLIPYAYNFVEKVYKEGLGCIVVTGSGQPTLIDKLENNYTGFFSREKMVTAFDVKKGKPHPEPYLKGLAKAGSLSPNQAIVVENAPRGVEAAVAAGIFTIAVNTGPIPDKVLADAGANIVLPSMKALYDSWEDIKRYLK